MKLWILCNALLIFGHLIAPTTAGWNNATNTCDTDGVIGTFSQDDVLSSLIVTPTNFTSNLKVDIKMDIPANDTSPSNKDVVVYVALDDGADCSTKIT